MNRTELDRVIAVALNEDLGLAGDITTAATVDRDATGVAHIVAREEGVISGVTVADRVFTTVDPTLACSWSVRDGDRITRGTVVASISGSSASILTAERTALNLIGHLSGIASRTASMVKLVDGTAARIADTRKTTPGLRALEKAAVVDGGGVNHRFGLHDAILVKDNHIGLGGGLLAVLDRLAARAGHMVLVEIEVDTIDQLQVVLAYDAARIANHLPPVVNGVLLDNMVPDQIRAAVELLRAHPAPITVEVSGGVNEQTVRGLAEAGAQIISVGALTHSVTCLDLGLDL
ncbi:carboxylating nicotinate-nucleotide diphosphorylase [Calidifontibacter terrae]